MIRSFEIFKYTDIMVYFSVLYVLLILIPIFGETFKTISHFWEYVALQWTGSYNVYTHGEVFPICTEQLWYI